MIDFHLPSDSQALVSESYVIMQNFLFSANLYLTLLPLSKHSMHKGTTSYQYSFMLPFHGFQHIRSLAQVACSVYHSLLHSAPSPFCSSSNSPVDQGDFKEGCLNLFLFSLHGCNLQFHSHMFQAKCSTLVLCNRRSFTT